MVGNTGAKPLPPTGAHHVHDDHSRRVLIIEDEPTARIALRRLLTMSGYDAEAVSTLQQGEERLRQSKPSCLVLDLMLPDGSGTDLLRKIRKAEIMVKVAVVSGAASPLREEAVGLGPDAFFRKPLDLSALLRWLQEQQPS